MDAKTIEMRLRRLEERIAQERKACADTSSSTWQQRCLVFMAVRTTIKTGSADSLKSSFERTFSAKDLQKLMRDAEQLWNEVFPPHATRRSAL